MTLWDRLFNFCLDFTFGFAAAGEWLTTPLGVNGLTPLELISFSGLLIYLGIAIVHWLNPVS